MSIPKAGAKPSLTIGSSHLKYSRLDLLTTYYETVVVKINNKMVRVQLDSGTGRTLVLQELANRLKLRHYSKHNLNLGGFDGLSSQSSEQLVTAQLKSIKTHHSFKMIMCVTPRTDLDQCPANCGTLSSLKATNSATLRSTTSFPSVSLSAQSTTDFYFAATMSATTMTSACAFPSSAGCWQEQLRMTDQSLADTTLRSLD